MKVQFCVCHDHGNVVRVVLANACVVEMALLRLLQVETKNALPKRLPHCKLVRVLAFDDSTAAKLTESLIAERLQRMLLLYYSLFIA